MIVPLPTSYTDKINLHGITRILFNII